MRRLAAAMLLFAGCTAPPGGTFKLDRTHPAAPMVSEPRPERLLDGELCRDPPPPQLYRCMGRRHGGRALGSVRLHGRDLPDVAFLVQRKRLYAVADSLHRRLISGELTDVDETAVARALIELEHVQSAEAIVAVASRSHPVDRRGLLRGVTRFEPAAVAAFGRAVLERETPTVWDMQPFFPAFIAADARDVVPRLQALKPTHPAEEGELLAVRARLGDEAALQRIRGGPSKYHAVERWQPTAVSGGLGDHPDDGEPILRFSGGALEQAGYEALFRYVDRDDPRFAAGRTRVLEVLRRRKLGEAPSRTFPAIHHAALFLLGHEPAGGPLMAFASGSRMDPRTSHAVRLAIRVGVPGAIERGLELIALDDFHGHQTRPLLELIAAHTDDPAWTVHLFHSDQYVRQTAVLEVARAPDPAACPIIVETARARAEELGIGATQESLWAITAMPDRACEKELEALALDLGAGFELRALAVQLLALTDDPNVFPILARAELPPGLARTVENMRNLVLTARSAD